MQTILKAACLVIASYTSALAQPMVVTTIPNNSKDFIEAGAFTYFTSGDALWRTDGTAAGTFELVRGIGGSRLWNSRGYSREYDGRFYFISGNELWRSDGTSAGTVRLHTSSGETFILEGTTDYLFFSASDEMTGIELYRTDGTASGTILLKDIDPGAASGYQGGAGVIANEFLFRANDPDHGRELWRSDGTSAGTVLVKDINPNGDGFFYVTGGYPNRQLPDISSGSRYYFTGNTEGTGRESWVSDGTEEGTFMLVDATPGPASSGYITFGITHNGYVYFLNGPDLWKTQGTTASTSFVKRIGNEENDFTYHFFHVYKGKVYFWAYSVPDEVEHLWVTDGTMSGTYSFFTSTERQHISFFETVNDLLVFTGDSDGSPMGLYRSDGAAEGTFEYARFNAAYLYTFPRDLTKAADRVFYGDHDGLMHSDGGMPESQDDYYHLFESDGESTASMRTLWAINTVGSNNITPINNKVLFTTYNNQQSAEANSMKLWIYDPAIRPEPVQKFTLVDAQTDEDAKRLIEGGKITIPYMGSINIRFDPIEAPGSVVFKLNDVTTRTETAPPYSLAGDVNGDYAPWQGAQPGAYKLTAIPYSEAGGTGTPGEALTINFTIEGDEPPPSGCTASGTILREYWDNVSGNTVSSIPTNITPTSTSQLTIFEGPTNSDTNYGARIRGYICPPTTGVYTFWIASNDHSELWLSTDDSPANKKRIAYVTGATNPRQWDKFASQKSTAITLTAGHRYYVEALHKQGAGTDNLAVGWQLPDGAFERPISGSRLSPATGGGNETPFIQLTSPENGQTYQAPANVVIEAAPSDSDGTISKVEFFWGRPDNTERTKLGEDAIAPYTFTWSNVAAGQYAVYARAHDNEGATSGYDFRVISVTGECTASGTITREYWANVQGNRVSDIPVNTPPTSTSELSSFQGPTNSGTNYGARIRGYICPPATGQYRFWIASNDHSELWLSTDDDPANKQRIAYVTGATAPEEYTKFATQTSPLITLTAGKRYYIEALHKQGVGSDHVSVVWTKPSGAREVGPIPGSYLSPYVDENATARISENKTISKSERLLQQISIYPNPAQTTHRELTIAGYDGIDETIETQVDIVNLTGDVVFSERISCGGDCSSYLMKVNEQLVPGVYLINLKANGMRSSKRLLVK
jgi:ELWxxDGT repeat protein